MARLAQIFFIILGLESLTTVMFFWGGFFFSFFSVFFWFFPAAIPRLPVLRIPHTAISSVAAKKSPLTSTTAATRASHRLWPLASLLPKQRQLVGVLSRPAVLPVESVFVVT
jgi:hypothetical protein